MKCLLVLFFLSSIFACKKHKETTSVFIEENKALVDDTIPVALNTIMGKFNPAKDSSFVLIDEKYADRQGMFMNKEAYHAFIKMWEAAQTEQITLVIKSATRNFDYQKAIWERKWKGQTVLSNGENASIVYPNTKTRALKILEYSSMPGTSRHHWGTDIDLNNFNNSWFEHGEGLVVYNWLSNNAYIYGFCQPYTVKDSTRSNGYNEEKWHWSYMPLSKHYTQYASKTLKDSMITGFLGSELCTELSIVNNFVLGINPKCK